MFKIKNNSVNCAAGQGLYCVWIRAHEGKNAPLVCVWIDPAKERVRATRQRAMA